MAKKKAVLVPNAGEVVKKSWASWAAYLGVILPEIIDIVLRAVDASPLETATKNYIRVGALVLVAVLRPLKQESLTPPKGGSS